MAARFCPYCNSSLRRDDINIEQTMALCQTCHNLFQFTSVKGGCVMVQPLDWPAVLLPRGFRFSDAPGELVVSRWLWTPRSLPLVMMAILWTVVTVAVALFGRDALGNVWPTVLAVMTLVMAGLLFLAAVRLFNRQVLRVNSERVMVSPEPVPWLGRRTWRADEITQILAEQMQTTQKDGSVRISYELRIATRANEVFTILEGLESPEEALYLEQQIEARLPIRQLAGKHADEVGLSRI